MRKNKENDEENKEKEKERYMNDPRHPLSKI